MSKKIIGIIAAIAVVVIIVLVVMSKPETPANEEALVEQSATIVEDSISPDSVEITETDSLIIEE